MERLFRCEQPSSRFWGHGNQGLPVQTGRVFCPASQFPNPQRHSRLNFLAGLKRPADNQSFVNVLLNSLDLPQQYLTIDEDLSVPLLIGTRSVAWKHHIRNDVFKLAKDFLNAVCVLVESPLDDEGIISYFFRFLNSMRIISYLLVRRFFRGCA